jgi:hypothetical protein
MTLFRVLLYVVLMTAVAARERAATVLRPVRRR